MHKMGYARLLLEVDAVPAGALIYIIDRTGVLTRFIHNKTMLVYETSLGDKSLLWFPSAHEILMQLNKFTPVGIHWSAFNGGSYHVTGMLFGNPIVSTVPVFKDGKRKGTRQIVSTQHLNIRAASFDKAVYHLLFAILGGKLKRHAGAKFEHIFWDNTEQTFKTEFR